MPKLTDLGLTNERVGQADLDYASMPDQLGSFQDPPQPGSYRFRFPMDMGAIWETMKREPPKSNPGTRISAVFDSSHPLTIIQSPGNAYNGDPFETRMNNNERRRGKADDPTAPEVSDMDYILRDVWKIPQKPATNQAYAQAFIAHANTEFAADIEWSWYCHPEKKVRVDNGQGGLQEIDQKGCGTRYYQKDIDKVPSNPQDPNSPKVFPVRIQCGQCGASVRAFANLTRFKA